MDAVAFGVVDVASRGGGAGARGAVAESAVDLDEVIFRVVEIVVRTIVEQVAGDDHKR